MKLNADDIRAALCRHSVPSHLHEGLVRYIVHQRLPGSFLRAVLRNDLHEAVALADEVSVLGLREIGLFLYNDAPAECWGNDVKVRNWVGTL